MHNILSFVQIYKVYSRNLVGIKLIYKTKTIVLNEIQMQKAVKKRGQANGK